MGTGVVLNRDSDHNIIWARVRNMNLQPRQEMDKKRNRENFTKERLIEELKQIDRVPLYYCHKVSKV